MGFGLGASFNAKSVQSSTVSPTCGRRLKMSDAAYDVLLDTGINISPLPIWMDEWEHPQAYVNPALLANIAREGVRV